MRIAVGAAISDVNRIAVDYAKDHAGELLGTRWYDGGKGTEPSERWPVTKSAMLAVRKIITDALSGRMPMSRVTEAIVGVGEFSKEQAKLILDTEITFAQSRGNLAAWKRAGVVKKVKWRTGSLHRDRDECDLNREAGAIPLGENFPSGVPAPPAHPNCNCSIAIAELNPPPTIKTV